jgi:hypothetical protein
VAQRTTRPVKPRKIKNYVKPNPFEETA